MTEHDEQTVVIQWARLHALAYPCLAWLHAIPNGAQYGADRRMACIQARRMHEEGLTPGICDLFLPWAAHDQHGFYIEMKRPGNLADVRPGQAEFMAYAESAGYLCQVHDSAEGAIEALRWYLEMPNE